MATITPRAQTSINPTVQKKQQFQAFVKNDAVLKNISETLGDATRAKKFVASIISAVSTNPSLQECQAPTIVSAALLGEALNLSPSPQLGHYYLVPFKDNKNGVTNATFQLGYKGYMQLAIRSGQYKKLNVLSIKEGELISYDPLDEELKVNLIEDEYEREQLPTIGYYAMFELVNGFKKTMYWSKRKMLAHAEKYSPAFSYKGGAEALKNLEEGKIPEKDLWKYSSFWFKDFDGMAYKTMLRQLISKWGIMSIEMQNAYTNDMSFKESMDPNAQNTYIEQSEDVIDSTEPIIIDAEELKEKEEEISSEAKEVLQNLQPSLL